MPFLTELGRLYAIAIYKYGVPNGTFQKSFFCQQKLENLKIRVLKHLILLCQNKNLRRIGADRREFFLDYLPRIGLLPASVRADLRLKFIFSKVAF
jgi:hypothetical protein